MAVGTSAVQELRIPNFAASSSTEFRPISLNLIQLLLNAITLTFESHMNAHTNANAHKSELHSLKFTQISKI